MVWYEIPGAEQDVVLCSAVTLARNVAGYPFPPRLGAQEAEALLETVGKLLSDNGFCCIDFTGITRTAACALVEGGYASPELLRVSLPHSLYLNEPCGLSAMLCGQDHIRLRGLGTGLALQDAYAGVAGVERQLDARLEFAFDERRGFLTQNPGEVGAALSAAVFLYLPTLAAAGSLHGLSAWLEPQGICLQNLEGEDSLFRLTARVPFGMAENEYLARLSAVVLSVVALERRRRDARSGAARSRMQDRIYRSYGMLCHARILSETECRRCLTDLRVGAACGLLPEVRVEQLTAILIRTQPALLSQSAQVPAADEGALDAARAAFVREQLARPTQTMLPTPALSS